MAAAAILKNQKVTYLDRFLTKRGNFADAATDKGQFAYFT